MAAAILCLQPAVSRSGFSGHQHVAAASSDITGKWHFVFQTEGGDRENEADFKLQGDQVTGKWNSTDVKGTFKDGDLNLAFPYTSDEAGMTATLKLKGKLTDNKLAGTWEYSEYTGMFTATRR
jgi:hypothetical protein